MKGSLDATKLLRSALSSFHKNAHIYNEIIMYMYIKSYAKYSYSYSIHWKLQVEFFRTLVRSYKIKDYISALSSRKKSFNLA